MDGFYAFRRLLLLPGILHAREHQKERKFILRFALIGAILVIVSSIAGELPFRMPFTSEAISASPFFFFVRLGIVMLLLTVCWFYAEYRKTEKSFVLDVSRESLLVYTAHLLVIYGRFWNEQSLYYYYGNMFGVWECIAGTLILAAVMIGMAIVWGWLKQNHFPLARVISWMFLGTIVIYYFQNNNIIIKEYRRKEKMDIVMLIVLIVVAVLLLAVLLRTFWQKGDDSTQAALIFQQQVDSLRGEMSQNLKNTTDTFVMSLKNTTDLVLKSLQSTTENMNQNLSSVTSQLQNNTGQMGTRLDTAAKVIQDVQNKLGELGKATQEIKELGQSVSKLEEMLKAPKLRGGLRRIIIGGFTQAGSSGKCL